MTNRRQYEEEASRRALAQDHGPFFPASAFYQATCELCPGGRHQRVVCYRCSSGGVRCVPSKTVTFDASCAGAPMEPPYEGPDLRKYLPLKERPALSHAQRYAKYELPKRAWR